MPTHNATLLTEGCHRTARGVASGGRGLLKCLAAGAPNHQGTTQACQCRAASLDHSLNAVLSPSFSPTPCPLHGSLSPKFPLSLPPPLCHACTGGMGMAGD